MPPQGKKEPRRFCPYCSGEFAEGYLWLHKRDFCPMRPGRREQINAEIMGLSIPPGQVGAITPTSLPSGMIAGTPATLGAGIPINNKFSNIIPINLEQEYANMVKVMKKKQEEDEEYQCGGCNATFNAKKQPKHCPECGVELG